MHRITIFLLLFLSGPRANAQQKPVVDGIAWLRSSISGKNPGRDVNENSQPVSKDLKSQGTWFIYLVLRKGQIIKPTFIHFNGQAYHAIAEKIEKTPVVISQPGIGNSTLSDTLWRKTGNQVMRIQPGELYRSASGTSKKISSSAPIRIDYEWKGKTFSYTITEIRKLRPLVLQ